MKKLFLISSLAGASEYKFTKEDVIKTYEQANRMDEIIVAETLYKGHLEKIVKDFMTTSYEDKIIIVLGGDGSINEVANLIYGTNISLGLIPTGTGNDFAKNFSYKDFSLADTFAIDIRPIDLIKINDMYCVNVTSLGFDTEVLAKAKEYLEKNPSLGKKSYLMAVANRIKRLSYEKLEIDLDLADGRNLKLSDDYLISAICNGAYYGSGFNPAPEARVDDGLINVILARKFPRRYLLPLVFKYKKGHHHSSNYIEEHLVTKGSLKSEKEFLANIDGEIFRASQINFEIIPQGLNWAYFKTKSSK